MRERRGYSLTRCLLVLLPIAYCLLPLVARAQQSQPVTVQTAFDRARATIGDPVVLTITIRSAAGVQVDTRDIENQFAPFELVSAEPPASQRGANDSTELRLRYRVAAYRTGALTLSGLTVPYTAGGEDGVAQSQPLSLAIDSVIPSGDPAADIRPLKPQIELPLPPAPPIRRIITGVGAVVAVLLLAVLVWRLLRRRRPLAVTEVPMRSPLEEEAHAELDRIVEEGLLARGEYQEHYAQLAACIRRYVTRRYGFPASALTTTELNDRMVRSGVGRWRARLVSGLLSECDAVHYAHYLPAPARADADLQMAYEIVDLTWTQEARPEESQREVGR